MGKSYRVELPKNGFDTYFICSDVHSKHIHLPTFKIMLEMAMTLKKKPHLIINGDLLDVDWLFKKNECFLENRKKASGIEDFFIPMFDEEMKWGNWFFDCVEKYFNNIVYIQGNHDERITWFSESKECPAAYKPYFNISSALKLKERNVYHARYNDWIDIGNLSITHGMYHGPSAQKKHYEASGGRSVIYGHVHKLQITPFTSRGETKQVWSLPCMSTLSPEYIKNSENDWSNGFMVINVYPNGNFQAHTIQIWENKFTSFDGKEYKGKIKLENW